MPLSLSPEQRRLRASAAAHARHAAHDPRELAVAGQQGLLDRFRRQAAEQWPDLPETEIERRAGHLLKSHMAKLALASSRARRKAAMSR